MNDKYEIRRAKRDDCLQLLDLIKALAIQSKTSDYEAWTVEDVQRDGFDTTPARFQCFVAEERNSGTLCGYALFYEIYFAWRGKGLWLENLYVYPDHRGHDLGTALVTKVAQVAYDGGYHKIEYEVFRWNTATEFYTKLGAVDITKQVGLDVWRMERDAIAALATKK